MNMNKTVLDLSIEHMRMDTSSILNAAKDEQKSTPEGRAAIPFRFCNHEHGHIIFVGSAPSPEDDRWRAFWELKPIVELAAMLGCLLINFDSDANTYEDSGFVLFTWEDEAAAERAFSKAHPELNP